MQSSIAKCTFINTKGQGDLLVFVLDALIFGIFNFSFKTDGLIETKLHVDPLHDKGMKVCARDLGHMTKTAAIPIYGKSPLKISGLKG